MGSFNFWFNFSVNIPRIVKKKRRGKKAIAKMRKRKCLMEVEEGEILEDRPDHLKLPPSQKPLPPPVPPSESSSDDGKHSLKALI